MSFVKRIYRKALVMFAVIGPAIIAGAANNDAGGISTYSYAGSRFGYLLLWVLVVNFLTLCCTQEMGVRLGMMTGKGLSSLIRERFGVRWTFFAISILFIANVAVTASEFAGLAAALEIFHISRFITVPCLAVVIYLLLYYGSFQKVERLFLGISLFLLIYIFAAVTARPDWAMVVKESITLHFPLAPEYLFAFLGVMGTTVTPWGQFFIQSYVVDKGVSPKHFWIQRWEVYFSALFTCFIAAMIMVTTKQVLFDHGIVVDSAATAALSLRPALGVLAEALFAGGFFAASLLGAFVLPLTTSYSICEALGFEYGVDTRWREAPIFYGIIAVVILLSALVVLLPFVNLFHIMLSSQVLNGILLPVILIFLIILWNGTPAIAGEKKSWWGKLIYNVITWETIMRLVLASVLLVIFSLAPQLGNLFVGWLGNITL